MPNYTPTQVTQSDNNEILIFITASFPLCPPQESYTTHGDNVRLAGEIISVIGAFVILVLEVDI